MKKKAEDSRKAGSNIVGFAACYKGETIAMAQSLDKLIVRDNVRPLLGNKDLLIKHVVPEGMIVVY